MARQSHDTASHEDNCDKNSSCLRLYALQLTALTPEVMEFAVWRVKYVDDPCESEAYSAPAGEGGKNEDDVNDKDNDPVEPNEDDCDLKALIDRNNND